MRPLVLKLFFFIYGFCAIPVLAQDRVSGALIADTQSGYLFFKDNVQAKMAPASLTKLMTLYITFSALEKGWLKWDDPLYVSEHAALQPRTNLGLYAGQRLTVRQAVDAVIVHSANDAAVVLSEALAQDENAFAQMMTQIARQLKMNQTYFKNASGLHEEGQETTPHDMAILALALIHHYPQYYPLFSQKSFDFNGRTYTSHNKLLNDQDVEGMKTGYVAASGYNIISTAQKDGTRLLGIVMGADNKQDRDQRMRNLLDKGFQKVAIQKQAVYSGELSPALDPLHRRLMLKKTDLTPYAFDMQRSAKRAIRLAQNTSLPVFDPIASQPNSSAWTIQVGAFRTIGQAVQIAQNALNLLQAPNLKITTSPRASLHRAQLTGFSDKGRAEQACHFLNQKEMPCFLVSKS